MNATTTLVYVDSVAARYGRREVFRDISFELRGGQALGVIGPNGAGKTTLLRMMVGLITPAAGNVRIDGLRPRDAATRIAVGYFAGESTLPGRVRASRWGALGTGDEVTTERRPLRALSRGTRQMLGLRTAFGRQNLRVLALDEPWEGLDPDGMRWLNASIEYKRDHGAAVILSSHRLHDLAGVCDAYLFMGSAQATLMKAHEIAPVGQVTARLLLAAFDRLRQPAAPRS